MTWPGASTPELQEAPWPAKGHPKGAFLPPAALIASARHLAVPHIPHTQFHTPCTAYRQHALEQPQCHQQQRSLD
eukprot:211648-Chlamydomonas_euryale.AAC.1